MNTFVSRPLVLKDKVYLYDISKPPKIDDKLGVVKDIHKVVIIERFMLDGSPKLLKDTNGNSYFLDEIARVDTVICDLEKNHLEAFKEYEYKLIRVSFDLENGAILISSL